MRTKVTWMRREVCMCVAVQSIYYVRKPGLFLYTLEETLGEKNALKYNEISTCVNFYLKVSLLRLLTLRPCLGVRESKVLPPASLSG